MNAADATSTRPYLIRALYEWCMDNGFTPYLAVVADDSVQVPREFVKDGEIVLNVSPDATSGLLLGNELIEFKARFGGVAREILVPVSRVIAIYARENGQGMAFPLVEEPMPEVTAEASPALSPVPKKAPGKAGKDESAKTEGSDQPEPPKPGGPRPTLTRVK